MKLSAGDRRGSFAFVLVVCALALGCEAERAPFDSSPPTPVSPEPSAEQRAAREALTAELGALTALDTDTLLASRAVDHATLGYDPLTAHNLDLVQASALALSEPQRTRLGRDGLVVTGASAPTFAYGYQTIYLEDLPVFISADSILEAMHRSYDEILKATERRMLSPELVLLLEGVRSALAGSAGSGLAGDVRADLDLYLSVAEGLLRGQPPAGAEALALYERALAHEGQETVSLFGVERIEDFSQYEPRGHYEGDVALEQYFRAMMWLGRVDLRFLETQPDHTQLFHRRQLEAALGMRALLDDAARARWARIDAVLAAFVGEHDYATLGDLDRFAADLGIDGPAGLEGRTDAALAQALVSGGYGVQRISSHVMINGLGEGTMPLSLSFAFLGQRYVVDSHVFSNVVYDRVQRGAQYRMMPSTLDVAYAALGNDEAVRLLEDELRTYEYAPDLESMRLLVESHGETYWEQDLYTGWLGALRAMSPRAGAVDEGLPAVARTEPWSRRVLATQLASWAELRHDTVLYAKQSYTGGAACEFPDGYVEPYPELFERIARWASIGEQAMSLTGDAVYEIAYFRRLGEIADMLAEMARHQRTGTPFTAEQLAFINDAVVIEDVCGGPVLRDGWYAELNYSRARAVEYDPTIADVHTQPTDEVGAFVGRVLHVGTGMPRYAVFTFETCVGPRAYVGLVSSYHEVVTENFERLTDDEWSAQLGAGAPPDPAFLGDLVVR